MTPEQLELERQAFEAWYWEYNQIPEHHRAMFTGCLSLCEARYEGTAGHTAWQAWLARAQQSAGISVEERLPKYDEKGYIQIVYIDDEGDQVSGDGAYIPNFGFLVVKPEVRSGELDWIEYETDTVTHWKYYDSLPPINA